MLDFWKSRWFGDGDSANGTSNEDSESIVVHLKEIGEDLTIVDGIEDSQHFSKIKVSNENKSTKTMSNSVSFEKNREKNESLRRLQGIEENEVLVIDEPLTLEVAEEESGIGSSSSSRRGSSTTPVQ